MSPRSMCDRSVTVDSPRRLGSCLLRRIWELNANVTAYDAAYVALAELLAVPLLTSDGRLAKAPGLRCQIEHPN